MKRALRSAALSLAVLAGIAGSAAAQARPTATGPGTSVRLGGGASMYQIDYGHRWLGGAHSWVDINPTWRYGIEAEGRWLTYNQDEGTHESTYLIGPRVVVRPGRIEPYVKGLVGVGLFQFPFGYAHGSYLVVAGGVGVDLHFGRRFQVRAIDVEYQTWPQFTFGALRPYGVSSGISYTIFRGSSEASHLRR